jgi:NADPH2:quinone reductase
VALVWTSTVRVNRLLLGNTSVVGVGWGAFWRQRPEFLRTQWTDLLPLLTDGKLDPIVGSVHPLSAAAAAITELDERKALGKVVLEIR